MDCGFYFCATNAGALSEMDDDSKLEFETSEDVEIVPSFDAMGLKDELLRGIYAYGAPLPQSYPCRPVSDVAWHLWQALRSHPPSSSVPSCRF